MKFQLATLSFLFVSSAFATTTPALDKPIALKISGEKMVAQRNIAQDSDDQARIAQCFQIKSASRNVFVKSLAGSMSSPVDQLIGISRMCISLEDSDPNEASALADPGVIWDLHKYSPEQQSRLYGSCVEVRTCIEDIFESHNQTASDLSQWQAFNKNVQLESRSRRTKRTRRD